MGNNKLLTVTPEMVDATEDGTILPGDTSQKKEELPLNLTTHTPPVTDHAASSMDFVSGVSGCVGGPNFFCDNHGLVGDEEELKKMLNDRPVAVAVDATPFQFYSSGILDCRSFHSLNHAVFAVGYNDDLTLSSETAGENPGEKVDTSELEWEVTHAVLLTTQLMLSQNK